MLFFLNSVSKINILSCDDITIEETLVSFPEHMRRGKLSKKEGAAQLGYGVLCHNSVIGQKYAEHIIVEILSKYGRHFDGVALHPPESAYPCSCDCCKKKFDDEKNQALSNVDLATARQFFIETYLRFQNEKLFPLVKSLFPGCELLLFTVPWLFENNFEAIQKLIPPELTIIEWDYNLESQRISSLHDRLKSYMAKGNKVWFMATGGFSFSSSQVDEQIAAVFRQIEIAESAGVQGIMYFLGPKKSDFIAELHLKGSTKHF